LRKAFDVRDLRSAESPLQDLLLDLLLDCDWTYFVMLMARNVLQVGLAALLAVAGG
jgi:hypothetical protein